MTTINAINIHTGITNTVLQGQGIGVAPAFSTATYPATTTINQILYSSANNVVSGLTSGNSGVLTTSATGVPSIDTTNFHVLSTGVQMKGNNTNTAPPAGFIGEYIIGSLAAVFPANGVATNISSISLTPGVWNISCNCQFNTSGIVTGMLCVISPTSASIAGATVSNTASMVSNTTFLTAGGQFSLSIAEYRVLLAVTTTYYLVGKCNFSTAGCSAAGRISATRVG